MKGFTLAELLIVVAIIGVLVAISVPIFTSQLEKSREATDKANIRTAMSELQAAYLTGETDITGDANIEYKVTNDDTTYATATITLVQTTAGWQTEDSTSLCNIGGLKVGSVSSKGEVVITMDADGDMTVDPAGSTSTGSGSGDSTSTG